MTHSLMLTCSRPSLGTAHPSTMRSSHRIFIYTNCHLLVWIRGPPTEITYFYQITVAVTLHGNCTDFPTEIGRLVPTNETSHNNRRSTHQRSIPALLSFPTSSSPAYASIITSVDHINSDDRERRSTASASPTEA